MQEDINQQQQAADETELDIRALILKYFSYWKWFLVSILLFTVLGAVYLKRQSNIYESNVIVLL